jgi:hypothetical protein
MKKDNDKCCTINVSKYTPKDKKIKLKATEDIAGIGSVLESLGNVAESLGTIGETVGQSRVLQGVMNPVQQVQKQVQSTQNKWKDAIDTEYRLCNVGIPGQLTLCDNFTSGNILIKLIGFILIGFALIGDLLLDWLTVIMDLAAGIGATIPILNSILSFIEQLGLDDVIDIYSGVVFFVWMGPVTAIPALIGELPEGIVELFPFWTTMAIVYVLYIYAVRNRYWKGGASRRSKGSNWMKLGNILTIGLFKVKRKKKKKTNH